MFIGDAKIQHWLMREKHVGKYSVMDSYLNIYMAIDTTCMRQYDREHQIRVVNIPVEWLVKKWLVFSRTENLGAAECRLDIFMSSNPSW